MSLVNVGNGNFPIYEKAEIEVNGMVFRDWESVMVHTMTIPDLQTVPTGCCAACRGW